MKAAALSLALVISAVQTVGWAECCCVLICEHQNDPCSECTGTQPAPCCDESEKQEAPCTHVQPSSEVAAHAAPLPAVILDVVLQLPVVPFQAVPDSEKTTSSFSQARGSPPLHLLHSVLLI